MITTQRPRSSRHAQPEPQRPNLAQPAKPQITGAECLPFYLLPRAPVADDRAFCALLAEQGVAVLPGHVIELPGYFRICLTATDEMIERALPVFAYAIHHADSRLCN